MPLQPLTPEQRTHALERAVIVRGERKDLKASLKAGTLTLADLLDRATASDVIGRMKVASVIESLPGIGKIRAKQVMDRLKIDEKRRVRGLGSAQKAALLEEFAPADA
jgi:signal recognition particle GTPase